MNIKTESNEIIDIEEFISYIGKEDAQIIDVRGESEYKSGHIKGADNFFVGTLENNLHKIDTDKQIVIYCQSGDRSALAQSLLAKHSIKVKNYSGGMKEWCEKDKKTVKL